MTSELPDDDEDLVKDLRAHAGQVDPPPQQYLEFAESAFALRDFDAELGRFVEETELASTARSRGSDRTVQVVFEEMRLLLAIGDEQLSGQLTPGGPLPIHIVSVDDRARTRSDKNGRFEAPLPSGEPFRVVIEGPDGRLTTGWIRP